MFAVLAALAFLVTELSDSLSDPKTRRGAQPERQEPVRQWEPLRQQEPAGHRDAVMGAALSKEEFLASMEAEFDRLEREGRVPARIDLPLERRSSRAPSGAGV